MRIISMTATFGKLDGDTLRFSPGLNVISAPNEWGKSTWCAFLTAMLYGVETRERTTKGTLADKEKYSPWSGRPMEGLLRLEHEGRDITIQRRTRGRVPLGEFLAYETHTGLTIPELTGENCGMTLLGVEKSVFQRTGMIRFSDLAVAADEALWQRLRESVAEGEESSGAAVLGKKLRELRNRCASPRNGLIPETRRQIEELESQLAQRRSLEQRVAKLELQSQSARQELEALERHRAVCAWREARNHREQTDQAVQAAVDARSAREELEKKCAGIPGRSELTDKLQQAQRLLDQLQAVREEAQMSPVPGILLGVLGIVALILGGFFLFREMYLPAAAAVLTALILGFCAGKAWDLRRSRALKQRSEQLRRERSVHDLMQTLERLRGELSLREELERARRTEEQTRIRLQSMVADAKQASAAESEDDLDLTSEETVERIAVLEERLRNNQLLLGQCQGRMESLPEAENLERNLEAQRTRLRELEQYEQALERGISLLEEASREFQRRFAPRITGLAQGYLERLTGGRYSRLSIGGDLTVLSGTEAETTLREGKWRSDGTGDQMYLALRLAMWVTLNPRGPLILDDALVRLDDTRLGYAMELLKELGQERQILLFSCQDREKKWL